jgi:hypothetical protein
MAVATTPNINYCKTQCPIVERGMSDGLPTYRVQGSDINDKINSRKGQRLTIKSPAQSKIFGV